MAIGQQVDFSGDDLYVNNIYKGVPSGGGGTLPTNTFGYVIPAQTLVSAGSGTITTLPITLTTTSLSTAGGASQAIALTLTGLVAGTPLDVTFTGGTNTVWTITPVVVATANTATVTLFNTGAGALNGTVKFTLTTV